MCWGWIVVIVWTVLGLLGWAFIAGASIASKSQEDEE